MNITSLILRSLAVLGAIAAIVLFFQVQGQKEVLETDLTSTRTELRSTQADLTQTRGELADETARANRLRSDLNEAEARATSLRARLDTTQENLREAQSNLRTANQEIASLTDERDNLNRALAESRRSLERLQDDTNAQIANFRSRISSLENQLEDAQTSEPDEFMANGGFGTPERDTPETPTPVVAEGPIRGTILSVGPQNSFVVLNAGTMQGLIGNPRVMIIRDSQSIGEAVVSRIDDELAIAQIQPRSVRGTIQVGDSFRINN